MKNEIGYPHKMWYSTIVNDGYDVETVIKNISLANPRLQFIPEETIIIFDDERVIIGTS